MVAGCDECDGFSMVGDMRQFLAVECGDMDGERHRKDRNVLVMCK